MSTKAENVPEQYKLSVWCHKRVWWCNCRLTLCVDHTHTNGRLRVVDGDREKKATWRAFFIDESWSETITNFLMHLRELGLVFIRKRKDGLAVVDFVGRCMTRLLGISACFLLLQSCKYVAISCGHNKGEKSQPVRWGGLRALQRVPSRSWLHALTFSA